MPERINHTPTHPLRKARKQCGFSQKELTRRMGSTTIPMLAAWERGESIPEHADAMKLAQLLIFSSAKEVQDLCQAWNKEHGTDASTQSSS
jgi:transcriptional regulator with XRE-family HTH domain